MSEQKKNEEPNSSTGAAVSDGAGLLYGYWADLVRYDYQTDQREGGRMRSWSSIRRSLYGNYAALQARMYQENEAAIQSVSRVQQQSAAMIGALATRFSASGVSGRSVTQTLRMGERMAAAEMEGIRFNRQATLDQIHRQAEAEREQAYQQLIASAGAPIQRPDHIGTAFRAGAQVARVFGGGGFGGG